MPERMLFILTFDSACHIYIFCPIWVCEIIYVYLGLVNQAITGIYFIEYVLKHLLKVDFDLKFYAVFVKRV